MKNAHWIVLLVVAAGAYAYLQMSGTCGSV